jgi:hypothetical protein
MMEPSIRTREDWIALAERIARPVLSAASAGRLRASLPVRSKPAHDRSAFAPIEAVCRTLVGLAPWFESGDPKCAELAELARAAIARGFDPASDDRLRFDAGPQSIVEAAFLSHAMLRAPNALWKSLDAATQRRVLEMIRSLRSQKPIFNNWLLFAAIAEALVDLAGEACDPMRVDYATRQHEQWYVGGGWYKDGPAFHHDYYNSFVIQPMMLDIAKQIGKRDRAMAQLRPTLLKRAQRMAELLERQIAPDGSFPVTGRSLAYRCGAFQLLAQLAAEGELPKSIAPSQAREALNAVISRTMTPPRTFDDAGWLTIGLCGEQPAIGETYISGGSVYLCAAALLPLGRAEDDPFWSDPPVKFTAQRAWSGDDVAADHD